MICEMGSDNGDQTAQDAIAFGFLGFVLALGLLGCVIYRIVTAAERRALSPVSEDNGGGGA